MSPGDPAAPSDAGVEPVPLEPPHHVVGPVEKGDQRGRALGIPTANVALGDADVPAEGVYAGAVTLPDGTVHVAAVSVGRRPTFYADDVALCEAHLLDYTGDLYGQVIDVVLTHFLRGQLRFESLDDLIDQMHEDCAAARSLLDPGGNTG